jgi:RNA polymerase sigma-70 factor (ECF subfamily)
MGQSHAGDSCQEARYRLLYEQHYGAVLAYARRRVAASDAEEAAAETFCVAWRRFSDVPPDNALPWLYAVARRVLAVQRRAGVRRERLSSRLALHVTSHAVTDRDPGGQDVGALGDAVGEALARLRRDDQVLLCLAVVDGLGAKEIGWRLACSPNAVSLRLHRARQRLTAMFGVVLRERRADASRGQPSGAGLP